MYFCILIVSEATPTPEELRLEWEMRQTEAGKYPWQLYMLAGSHPELPVTNMGLCFTSDISTLTKKGNTYAQALQEEEIFSMIPKAQ